MGVEQAGDEPFTRSIHHVDGLAVFEMDVGGQRADAFDAIALDHDGVIARRWLSGAVDQHAVADDECLLGGAHCGTHGPSGEIASFEQAYSSATGNGIAACACVLPLPRGERAE